jgi:TPP-dependent pyruvate/acetoin dehydrogenase alpha subunit
MTSRPKSKPHPHAALPAAGSGSLISDARLAELYAAMLRCRMLRERIRGIAGRSKQRRFASSSEAVDAATIIGLLPQDSVISSAPHLCAALLKDAPLKSILRPLCARPAAAHPGGAERACTASGVLAASFDGAGRGKLAADALAAGAAFAGKRNGDGSVVVAFYEGIGNEDSRRAIFDFATAHELPLILVRQAPRPLQPGRRRGHSGRRTAVSAPGALPIIPVDSNDAVAVYRVAHEAIAHARRGSGPTLIDCVPLRLAGERRQDSDCIARMERYLAAKGLRPERIKARVSANFTRALDSAVAAIRSGPRASQKNSRSAKTGK